MALTFNLKYFTLAVLSFLTEVFIALFVKDKIIRPFVGDVLVVILIYCFVRIFLSADYLRIALGVLAFACMIEILQYFDYVALLHLENNRILSVMMGRTFELMDFVAYSTGFALIILTEKYFRHRTVENHSL